MLGASWPCLVATLADVHGKRQKAEYHEYNVRVARDDKGEGFVVTCDNKCHLDGSRAELVGRYVVVEGGGGVKAKDVDQRWLWS